MAGYQQRYIAVSRNVFRVPIISQLLRFCQRSTCWVGGKDDGP
jgi:hypothetical protein